MDILLSKNVFKPISFLIIFLLASSCGMGAEAKCTTKTILSDITRFDIIMIGQSKRTSVYAAEIWMTIKITDTT